MKSLPGRCAVALVAGGCAGYLAAGAAADPGPPGNPAPRANTASRVTLAAAKYEFSAQEIRMRKGERVTFVLTTPDFVHGFSVPDLNVRADVIPGKPVEVTVTPDRAGRFVFLCDNFCGDGHDRMTGILVVSD